MYAYTRIKHALGSAHVHAYNRKQEWKNIQSVHASSALLHNQVSLVIVRGYLPGEVVNEKWFSKQVAYCRWPFAQLYDLMFRRDTSNRGIDSPDTVAPLYLLIGGKQRSPCSYVFVLSDLSERVNRPRFIKLLDGERTHVRIRIHGSKLHNFRTCM